MALTTVAHTPFRVHSKFVLFFLTATTNFLIRLNTIYYYYYYHYYYYYYYY